RLGAPAALHAPHPSRFSIERARDLPRLAPSTCVQLPLLDTEDPLVGAHPQVPRAVLEHPEDPVLAKAIASPEGPHRVSLDACEPIARSDPEDPLSVLEDGVDHFARQPLPRREREEAPPLETVQTPAVRPEPED